MIFVTLGSQKFQFNRLLKEIDKLIENKIIVDDVIAQIGVSDYSPKNYKTFSFLPREDFQKYMNECEFVITHAGTGAIITALKSNKRVIAVPRLERYGEHVDNHQIQLIDEFKKMNLIEPVYEIENLKNAIENVKKKKYNRYESNTKSIIDDIDKYISEDKNENKNICFLANKYPNIIEKNGLVFVQQLVWSIAEKGVKCVVICPLAVNLYPKLMKVPYHIVEKTINGSKVDVYFPKFFGLGQSHYILGKSPVGITTNMFAKTVLKVIKKEKINVNYIYGHFLAPAGISAARIGKKLNIPSYFAYGESNDWTIKQFGKEKAKKELNNIAGVISVSTRNKKLLIENDIVPNEKIRVFPNGYRSTRFMPRDKIEAREMFGLPKDKFIVGFVGSFDKRKGILRLEKAVDKLDDVYFICAGKGDLVPTSKKCLFANTVNNDKLSYFYSAMDAFVLPTLNEGCCNAIVEAMACGCPIISSNLSFNDDILNDKNSIRINPNNIDEIKDAIYLLYKNQYQKKEMSKESLLISQKLTLSERANNIIQYIMKDRGENE